MAQISNIPFIWLYILLLVLSFFVIIVSQSFLFNKWSVISIKKKLDQFIFL